MSILDDAIREHLELKRAHGADESELKKLEDEAFGPPGRPEEANPFAEAPTEFLATPEAPGEAPPAEAPEGRREPNIADLQEAPPAPEAPPAEEPAPPEEPKAEEAPAPAEPSHTTQEREAIAQQPTEFFDVQAEMESEEEPPAGAAPSDAAAPSDEDLADAGQSEPRMAQVDPLTHIEDEAAEAEAAEEPVLEDEEEEDDFFSEQRLSDELNQALETPLPGEPQLGSRAEEPIPPGPHTEEAEAHYAERDRAPEGEAEEAEPEPESEELERVEPEEHVESEPTQLYDFERQAEPAVEEERRHEEDDEESEQHAADYEPETDSHDDVLEDTPEFLEDAPEDDDLWFEQRPPKDFDFDD